LTKARPSKKRTFDGHAGANPDFHETTSVLDEALRSSADLIAAEKELQALEHEIAERPIPNHGPATPRFSRV